MMVFGAFDKKDYTENKKIYIYIYRVPGGRVGCTHIYIYLWNKTQDTSLTHYFDLFAYT